MRGRLAPPFLEYTQFLRAFLEYAHLRIGPPDEDNMHTVHFEGAFAMFTRMLSDIYGCSTDDVIPVVMHTCLELIPYHKTASLN